MNSSFVSTWRVPPPTDRVISVSFGSSVCFAAKSKYFGNWVMCANGKQYAIEEPPLWLCEEEYARTHQRNLDQPEPRKERVSLMRKSKKPQQLSLF